jgi:hypothetical protein
MKNKLHHTIKENNNTIILNFNSEELEKLPVKVALKTLEIIEKNNRMVGYFIEFDKKTEEFITKNKEQYKEEIKNENENFKRLSHVYFDELSGPLYVYANRVLEYVEKIYEVEPLVSPEELPTVPKINYTLKKEEGSEYEKVLMVKNVDELVNKFGKAITLHTLVLFKEHLNFEYQMKNKVAKQPYCISTEIKISCFNEEENTHEYLENFKGSYYFMQQMFDNQSKKINNPEEILELLLIRENLRKNIENSLKSTRENIKLKIN